MAKSSKRFNWKARQVVETIIDETEQKKIKIEFESNKEQYDASNALVLPSRKRKTKKIKKEGPTKLLSKKQRKKLLKIQEKKLKKSKREKLFEKLQEFQAKPQDMFVLTSLQSIQTLGRKKIQKLSSKPTLMENGKKENSINTNCMLGKLPKPLNKKFTQQCSQKKVKDFSVVQSESSSSSEDTDDEDESEKVKGEKCDDHFESTSNSSGCIQCPTTTTTNELHTKEDDKNKNVHESNKRKLEDEEVEKDSGNILGPKTLENQSKKTRHTRKSFKKVQRDSEVQEMRLKLPILSEEHSIMEAISENPITIIVGQTGSGKTTQVPQFLYEAGYTSNSKMIGVTEPRRVAAISMAERVGFELNLSPRKVSYQVRFEGNTTNETEIKFMTDGILFKEVLQNHLLENYSAIIIDEAHERSIHSDILIGLLSRIVLKRNKRGNPLKLIIMSATLRIEDFTENATLFPHGKPPVVKIDSRMFDVTIYFNKVTEADYCASAYKKVCKIHRQLPDGGILLFLTGQQEIKDLCRKLKETFPANLPKDEKYQWYHKRIRQKKEKAQSHKNKKSASKIPEVNLQEFSLQNANEKSHKLEASSDEDALEEDVSNSFLVEAEQPLWVLPLYGVLPRQAQKKVFEPPPAGTRLCVIATNIAETSLTIPNIKYVVDSGKTKEKFCDPFTGVSSYQVVWTSKASANQRAGRSGRTSEGFCYRLYSSAVFNEFAEYPLPDICQRPLDDVVLSMKALKVPVNTFPFPTPPDPAHLTQSIKRLTNLGALMEETELKKTVSHLTDRTVITEMGLSMSALPVAPRFAKMILYGNQHAGILPYIILLIAALSVQEVFIEIPLGKRNLNAIYKHWEAQRLKWSGMGASRLLGDLLIFINAVLDAERNHTSFEWCQQNGIRYAALMEIRKLRRQLTDEINLLMPQINLPLDPTMQPPTDKQTCIIAEVVFMGSLEQVACRVESHEIISLEDKEKGKFSYRVLNSEKLVFLSSSSTLHKSRPKYVMYQEMYETTKIYLRVLTVVDESWLVYHGASLVTLFPPMDAPQPRFDCAKDSVVCWRKGEFGPHHWPLQECEVPYPYGRQLFKWVAYFFLIGHLWPPLKKYAEKLFDPKTIISPISLRYRTQRENLIQALLLKKIVSSKSLKDTWKEDPLYLKSQYLAWFRDIDEARTLIEDWPMALPDETWRL